MCRWRISETDHHKPFNIIQVQESFAMGCSPLAVCYSLFQNKNNARRKASEVEGLGWEMFFLKRKPEKAMNLQPGFLHDNWLSRKSERCE